MQFAFVIDYLPYSEWDIKENHICINKRSWKSSCTLPIRWREEIHVGIRRFVLIRYLSCLFVKHFDKSDISMKFIKILFNWPPIYLYSILFHPLQLITKSKPSFFLSSIKIYTIPSIYQEFYSFYISAQQSPTELISSIYLKKSYTIYHSITLSTFHLSI